MESRYAPDDGTRRIDEAPAGSAQTPTSSFCGNMNYKN
jgi:hypothetical protein